MLWGEAMPAWVLDFKVLFLKAPTLAGSSTVWAGSKRPPCGRRRVWLSEAETVMSLLEFDSFHRTTKKMQPLPVTCAWERGNAKSAPWGGGPGLDLSSWCRSDLRRRSWGTFNPMRLQKPWWLPP